jgi:hypothetical protein
MSSAILKRRRSSFSGSNPGDLQEEDVVVHVGFHDARRPVDLEARAEDFREGVEQRVDLDRLGEDFLDVVFQQPDDALLVQPLGGNDDGMLAVFGLRRISSAPRCSSGG